MAVEKIDIVLPNRIGDVLLTLPALVCLKQLREKFGPGDTEYGLVSYPHLMEILQSLNLFSVTRMGPAAKIGSWLKPADKAYFLVTTNKNLGYHSKHSLGLKNPGKKFIRYSADLPYLRYPHPETALPGELVNFLKSRFNFSGYPIRHFGICLEQGYSIGQIMETFNFDGKSLAFPKSFFDWQPPVTGKYLVFCMEAASGRKKVGPERRWKEEHFLALAERACEKYSLQAAFIGINDIPKLPENPYFIDFRGKLSLKNTAQLLHYSGGYVGNDTGPLHLANLMGKKSIGMYFHELAITNYGPLFPQLNTIFYKPKEPQDIYDSLDALVKSCTDQNC